MLFFVCVMPTFCKWRKEKDSFLTQFSISYEVTFVTQLCCLLPLSFWQSVIGLNVIRNSEEIVNI